MACEKQLALTASKLDLTTSFSPTESVKEAREKPERAVVVQVDTAASKLSSSILNGTANKAVSSKPHQPTQEPQTLETLRVERVQRLRAGKRKRTF